MGISIVPFIGVFCFAIQVVYPLWRTLSALYLKSPQKGSPERQYAEVSQWAIYWVIYSLYSLVERSLLFFLVDYLPLYAELKCVVTLWLVLPEFNGASYIWDVVCQKSFRQLDAAVQEFLETKAQVFMSIALGQSKRSAGGENSPMQSPVNKQAMEKEFLKQRNLIPGTASTTAEE